jgi:UDP-N-acetyl-D-galactosamine dehydrogenase
MRPNSIDSLVIAVIGLGYVGLPLAVSFAQKRKVIGFDINEARINALREGNDLTLELTKEELFEAKNLQFTSDEKDLTACNCFIVTVPTPVDSAKRPDLSPLLSATRLVAGLLKEHDIVIYESTVFPGATEENCGELLAEISGLQLAWHNDCQSDCFYLGYSPERVNPGDKQHKIQDIVKVTSGSTPAIAELINDLYASIITAGTFKASSMRVAEAAKVIENIQRDVNIALVNELAMIFDKLNIDTQDVLQAAGTKWNFLPFKPGLVGGHCIGVDPYYLTHKAVEIGHNPEIILAGRRINDAMAEHVATKVLKLMLGQNINPLKAKILMLGLTFKEDCPDIRNSKVFDLLDYLGIFNCDVDVFDPLVVLEEVVSKSYPSKLIAEPAQGHYDVIILAVPHRCFLQKGVAELRSLGKANHVFFDLKSAFPADLSDGRL